MKAKEANQAKKSKVGLHLNVGYEVKDKNGKVKKLFQENSLYRFLMKHGILSPKSLKIPFILGTWQTHKLVPNLTTTVGKGLVAGLMTGDVTNYFDYIAVGTGTTAANVADTTLETEIADSGLSRASSTNSRVTTDTTNDTAQFVKAFSVSGTKAVTESGLFDASSSGNMLARQVFSAINVVSGDSLTITWKIDVD